MARVPPRRVELLAAAEQLEALARRLLEPGLVSARGVAQVRLLLGDASGPLYHSRAREDLGTVAERALEALQPSFAW